VRGLCVRAARGTLVSAGADGTVHHWDLSGHGGLTVDCLKMTHKLPKAAPGEDPNRAICAVDVSPGSDTVVVGTAQSKVLEISGSGVCTTLVAGHSADLYQVCRLLPMPLHRWNRIGDPTSAPAADSLVVCGAQPRR
jgi:WD40 repeat protein